MYTEERIGNQRLEFLHGIKFFLKIFWEKSVFQIECNLIITSTQTTTLKNCGGSKASFFQMSTRCQGFSFSKSWHSNKPLELPCSVRCPLVSFPFYQQVCQALPSVPTIYNYNFNSLVRDLLNLTSWLCTFFLGRG